MFMMHIQHHGRLHRPLGGMQLRYQGIWRHEEMRGQDRNDKVGMDGQLWEYT